MENHRAKAAPKKKSATYPIKEERTRCAFRDQRLLLTQQVQCANSICCLSVVK
jgi:hypothetical protein